MALISPQQKIATLLQHPSIWQAKQQHSCAHDDQVVSSGYKILDNSLHLGGWPCNGSTEFLSDQYGIGELTMLMPALSELNQRSQHSRVALVAPPHIPYAPALARSGIDLKRLCIVHAHKLPDKLWASEQLLRSGHFVAVLSWFNEHKISYAQLRKLQLAAQEGSSWLLSFRPESIIEQSSPAKLRVHLQAKKKHLLLNVLKQQGGWAGQQVLLPRPTELLNNTLNVQNWLPTDVVASHTLTLTAAGGFHPQLGTTNRLRGDSTTTRRLP